MQPHELRLSEPAASSFRLSGMSWHISRDTCCVTHSCWHGESFKADRSLFCSTAEVTVLLHRDHRRKGYAKELLQAIIAKATSDGLKNLIASISGDNSASLALFEKLGFKRVGVFEQVGWRNDTWLDLVQMQLKL